MTFLYPEFIYLMLLPAAFLIYLIQTNKDLLERIFDQETLMRLRIPGDALGRRGHNVLLFVAFFFMTLALARPVIEEGKSVVQAGGVPTVVALDLSTSMRAKDFYPDRLRFARQKVADFVSKFPGGPVGVIAFDRGAFVAVPMTEDKEALLFLLRRLGEKEGGGRGTDLAVALEGAARLLGRRGGVVLLVTDGGNHPDVQKLIKVAKKRHLRVVVWMMATPQGAPVPERFLPADLNGTTVMSRAEPALRRLAEATGGRYVEASLSQRDEEALEAWFAKTAHQATRRPKVIHRRIELFYYPLALALLVLPFALYSFGGRQGAALLFLPILAALPESAKAGLFDFLTVERGIKAYRAGDYNTSSEAFEKLTLHTHRPEVWFDLGNSYYKSGRYKMACDAYSRVVTRDPRIESAKLYNLGNCYVRLGKLERAAAFYEKVLTLWNDPDARHNLALVRKLLARRKRAESQGGQKSTTARPQTRKGAARKGGKNASGQKGGASNPRQKGKRRPITPAEERKWMALIKKEPFRTRLYPLIKPKEGHREEPW